jgi:hypothetical protein
MSGLESDMFDAIGVMAKRFRILQDIYDCTIVVHWPCDFEDFVLN